MKTLLALLLFATGLYAQVAVYGTIGAVQSGYWSNPALSFGGGTSFTRGRLTVGGDAWRAEVSSLRSPSLSSDRRAEAALGFVGVRTWRGLHFEGGGGVQRLTDTAYGPLLEGQQKYSATFGHAGAYYQTGRRFFMRVGYRRLFVRNDHDTDQVYTSVGVSF